MAEKRTRQLPPLRVTEELEIALLRLAAHHERDLSDYLRRVLERHVFGHGVTLHQDEPSGPADRA